MVLYFKFRLYCEQYTILASWKPFLLYNIKVNSIKISTYVIISLMMVKSTIMIFKIFPLGLEPPNPVELWDWSTLPSVALSNWSVLHSASTASRAWPRVSRTEETSSVWWPSPTPGGRTTPGWPSLHSVPSSFFWPWSESSSSFTHGQGRLSLLFINKILKGRHIYLRNAWWTQGLTYSE